MKPTLSLTTALCALALSASVHAQLKLPKTEAPAAAVAPAAAPAASTGDNAEKEKAGQVAAAGWLVLLDRRDWGRAWETSGSMFRTSVPLPAWMDGIPKLRDPMGALVERVPGESVYKTTLEGRPDGEYVTSLFQTKFASREVEEVVTTVHEADGRWRVTGYLTR